jgi:hypothetical protein
MPSGSLAPTDVGALMRHVAHLSADLERVWSDALEPARLETAQTGLAVRIKVLFAALAARYGERDAELASVGVEVQLPDWPPSQRLVLGLDRADPRGNWRLAMIAQLQACELLAQAIAALTEPSGRTIDVLGQRELRRWCEAGAFAFLRSSARLVERLTHDLEAAEAVLLGGEPYRAQSLAGEAYGLAAAAHMRGDPEGALLHAVRCAAVRVGSPRGDGNGDRWASLRSRKDRVILAELLDCAEEVVDSYARGQAAVQALPLVTVLLPQLERLASEPLGRMEP